MCARVMLARMKIIDGLLSWLAHCGRQVKIGARLLRQTIVMDFGPTSINHGENEIDIWGKNTVENIAQRFGVVEYELSEVEHFNVNPKIENNSLIKYVEIYENSVAIVNKCFIQISLATLILSKKIVYFYNAKYSQLSTK
jgi:hypothetical protein